MRNKINKNINFDWIKYLFVLKFNISEPDMTVPPRFLAPLFLLASVAVASADDRRSLREYRPLEARRIAVSLAGKAEAVPGREKSAAEFRSLAWRHFDKREWGKATDAFLSALERSPRNVEAAEGLAMSVYHSGDYASAFRLGEELARPMPSVRRIVSETVLADVRSLVAKEDFAGAGELLAFFPASDGVYAEARELAVHADTLVTALRHGRDTTPDPAPGGSESLAKN